MCNLNVYWFITVTIMLCSRAFAAAGPGQGSDILMSILPFVLIFVLMYFLMIRPQQKKAAEHQKLVDSLEKGDRVVTSSGVIGVIARKRENDFLLEIADGVQITILKNAISGPYTSLNDKKPEAKVSAEKPQPSVHHQPKASDTNTVRRVKKKDRV